MRANDYLENPCEMSSLPFWKTNAVTIPENMLILRDDMFIAEETHGHDDPYFRMLHDLCNIPFFQLDSAFQVIDGSLEDFSDHINECYDREHISVKELETYKTHPVFDQSLWISIAEKETHHIVATGIAEYDSTISEGILEWIQVSPSYRHRGLGKFVVCELLRRMLGKAKFVTVSGRINNSHNPYALYRSCGFDNPVIWHVITK